MEAYRCSWRRNYCVSSSSIGISISSSCSNIRGRMKYCSSGGYKSSTIISCRCSSRTNRKVNIHAVIVTIISSSNGTCNGGGSNSSCNSNITEAAAGVMINTRRANQLTATKRRVTPLF